MYRKFWVSWYRGYVRVGTGSDVLEAAFMTWRDPKPLVVGSVALSSSQAINPALWRLPLDVGE